VAIYNQYYKFPKYIEILPYARELILLDE